MTGPTDHPDDELTEALRRELSTSFVPYDDRRADEMIGRATQAEPLDVRRWNAPLAAAAAVVLVGGGAAIIAANVGHGHHDAAPAAGGFALCGPPSPVPSAASSAAPSESPSVEPTEAPTAAPTGPPIAPSASSTRSSVEPTESPVGSSSVGPSRSTSSVPGVQLPPHASGVRVSAAPTVVFPLVVSGPVAPPVPSLSATPSPSAAPVSSQPAPSPSASSTDEPCATPSVSAAPASASAPALSVAPAPALSATPSAAPSASTSPAYEPPIPPTPTKPGETNAVPVKIEVTADPGGTAEMIAPPIPSDRKFVVTSLIWRNTVPGSDGTVTLVRGSNDVLTESLANFRALDHTFTDEPIVFSSDDPAALTMDCAGPSACNASVLLVGNYVGR
jgi:hypothetical protein